MSKKTIAVLFGGVSSEHAVSLVSASSVLRNIPSEKYNVICIGITKNGRWIFYDGSIDDISSAQWENDDFLPTAVLSPDRTHHGLLKISPNGSVSVIHVDCVFPVLHGRNGEDGTVQGLLELAGVPFVGCGMLSSAVCMDKEMTHTVLDHAGIRTARWLSLLRSDVKDIGSACREAADTLGLPIFVKPANAGSSIGISKAETVEELKDALLLAWKHDSKAVLEEMITGAEVECAVLGNRENAAASVLGQIIPVSSFYDYEAKYVSGSTVLDIPANISEAATKRLQETAVKAYLALGCSGFSRVDFFVTEQEEIILNEVNTIPGFTDISMYPKLWAASGIPYSELIDRLINLAVERKVKSLG